MASDVLQCQVAKVARMDSDVLQCQEEKVARIKGQCHKELKMELNEVLAVRVVAQVVKAHQVVSREVGLWVTLCRSRFVR